MFREIVECFERGPVVEASQTGSIVVFDEGLDEDVSLIVGVEAVFATVPAGRRSFAQGLGEPSVEALCHAVGLRVEGAGQAMFDPGFLADRVEGVAP